MSKKELYKKIDKEVEEYFKEARRLNERNCKLAEQLELGKATGLLIAKKKIQYHRFT